MYHEWRRMSGVKMDSTDIWIPWIQDPNPQNQETMGHGWVDNSWEIHPQLKYHNHRPKSFSLEKTCLTHGFFVEVDASELTPTLIRDTWIASGPSCQMALGLQECDLRKKIPTESEGMFFWHPVFFGKGTEGWLTKDLHVLNGLDYWIGFFFWVQASRLLLLDCWRGW